ncbi:MAG: glycosyltransferase family 39 protein [Chloroflexota bacterium]
MTPPYTANSYNLAHASGVGAACRRPTPHIDVSPHLYTIPAMGEHHTKPLRLWEWGLLLCGLLLFIMQAALASPQKSAAFDEEYHIAAGYAYLKTGDFRMSSSHPPLINLLSAVPLLWLDNVNLPTDHPSWEASDYFVFSDVFLWQVNDNPQQILVWGRWPVILLGALLALALFVWARQMAGPWAGWAALALAVFDPNLLANARLITTDLGLTCLLLLTLWRLWCWRQRPSPFNLILVGILAGLTMSSKFTGLLVWPIIGAVVLVAAPRRWRSLLVMALFAYLALWAVFRFDVGPIPGFRWQIPIPAPYYPYSVWDTFMVIEQEPKAAFLLGQVSDRGWWYYFPVALSVKTPLSLLLLTVVSSSSFCVGKRGVKRPFSGCRRSVYAARHERPDHHWLSSHFARRPLPHHVGRIWRGKTGDQSMALNHVQAPISNPHAFAFLAAGLADLGHAALVSAPGSIFQ